MREKEFLIAGIAKAEKMWYNTLVNPERSTVMKIGILGAGTWGCALALLLANNNHDVTLWSAIGSEIDELSATGRPRNLDDVIMPDSITYTKDISDACDAELVIFVVPSQFIRSTAALACKHVADGTLIACASKGIEQGTLFTMTEIIDDEMRKLNRAVKYELVALSGPTHAEEVAKGLPTSIVAATENEATALRIAEVFSSTCLRAYANTDVKGVELCGALKNIIAIAAGANRGMGFGDNSTAMLITRGMAEITRIGLAMGCNRATFMGLAGIGDLIVTATSRHSRNNRCGELIGKGYTYEQAKAEIGMVVEGYHALEAAVALSEKYGVEMPITRAVYDCVKLGKNPREAMLELMTRELKVEN